MSTRTTTTGLQVTPAGGAGLAVNGSGIYGYGSWVEFLASSSGTVHAAGIVYLGGTWAGAWHEIEIGAGAAAAEVAALRWQSFSPNSGNGYPRLLLFPVPVWIGAAGTRVAMRSRRNGSSAALTLSLLYYLDLVSDHAATVPIGGEPTGAVGVSVTPNAVAWAWSAWVELTPGIGNEIAITGITPSNPVASVDVEYELGMGAAAAEVPITRFRAPTANATNGQWRHCGLAAPHPIAASTRIAIRMRKAGTSTTAHQVQLLYLDGTALL